MSDANLKSELVLNNLRELVRRLESSQKQPIRDDNVLLAPICGLLERVLRIGLKRSILGFGLKKWDYWCWIEALPSSCSIHQDRQSLALLHAITFTKSSQKVQTYQGFGRIFIRIALMKKLMGYIIQTIQDNRKLLKNWYSESSLLTDKVMSETFRQVLDDIGKHVFELNLKNASFLDECWIIPEVRETQIVPCKELGLIVRHVDGRVIVAHVKNNGAAGDAGIECGDTIDELCGQPLLKIKNGKVLELLKQNVGKPVQCTLVKAKLSNGTFFPPSAERIKVIHDDPYKEGGKSNEYAPQQLAGIDETPVHTADTIASYSALFYGRVETGEDGSTLVIEDGILNVLKQANKPRDVELHLSETNLRVIDTETSKVLSAHTFTETSSCGRRSDRKDIIAFVSGDTNCAIAKKFYCYVFQVKDPDIAKVILYSIADGFCRTVWFV